MLIRFVENSIGEKFRELLEGNGGVWLISHDEPAAPVFVGLPEVETFKRIKTPDTFVLSSATLSSAEKNRLELIRSLLDDERCVMDKIHRLSIAKVTSEKHQTTVKRVLRLYYRYLATGALIKKKTREAQQRTDFNWAIQTFYFSSKKVSLRCSYELMLVQRFSDESGNLLQSAPSFSSFKNYFYRHGFHKRPQKSIARDGLSNYQRNERPVFGAASQWRTQIGSFQMDATLADIYLVSRHDRATVVGRPTVILAVDTATQLIAGLYIGLGSDTTTVMSCLSNCACDKVEFCKQHEVEILAEQWPSRGLPLEIITDKGREFTKSRMLELCQKYGIEIQSLPPFRPDCKGLVEKSFDLIQQRYKPLLRGKGVIEDDAEERWATDYRSQAILTIDEFTKVVIHCVIYLNSGRLLSDGKTAAQKWQESTGQLLQVADRELYLMTLPRETVKLSRKGFHMHSFWYIPVEMGNLIVGQSYVLAHDPACVNNVYVFQDGCYLPCVLSSSSVQYVGLSDAEAIQLRRHESVNRRAGKQQETQASVNAINEIQKVIDAAKAESSGLSKNQDGKLIAEHRVQERRKLT